MKYLVLVASIFLCTLGQAEARKRTSVVDPNCNITMPCEGVTNSVRGERIAKHMGFGTAQKVYKRESKVNYREIIRETTRPIRAVVTTVAQMLPHPSGCPSRQFCGCGAAVEVFGTPRRDLWLAANWLKFPRTSPAPGMVAARRGHVFVLRQQMGNGSWLVADHNSGGHASRLHVRSIAGYTIVNPHV